jgi:predicted TIM-barrel fold metal-dependent hydrolase
MAPLACADISDADKRKIAGDNFRQLIAWCKPAHPKVAHQKAADEFVEYGRTGRRPASMVFDDCHGHLGGHAADYHLPDCDLDGIVGEMERIGTRRICAFSFTGVTSDETLGNDIIAEAVEKHPDRFVGFTLVNPHRGRDLMLKELERGAKMGLRGVKLIPHYQGYPEEGPNIDVACQWAHERKQVILDHNWGSPARMEKLVSSFPDACFITGHLTLAYADIMKRYKNLFVCSCPLLGPRACEDAVAAIGADRLMFGSDLQDLPIAWGLGPILFARLPVESKKLILGGNIRRVLEQYSLKA